MTTEQLKQTALAMLAFADGKPVEYKRYEGEEWMAISDPLWRADQCEYRPAPEPVTRPWSKPSDVPGPVCWLMLETQLQSDFVTQIVTIGTTGIRAVFETGKVEFFTWAMLVTFKPKHSIDRKAWAKCEVSE